MENYLINRKNTYFISPIGDDEDPGNFDKPWKTINHAAEILNAGDTVLIRGGTYHLENPIILRNAGDANAWITYIGYPGEEIIIDAQDITPVEAKHRPRPYRLEQGTFHLENISHICIQNLNIINSHWAGICIIDSQYIDVINNTIDKSFSSGISIWDTTRNGVCHHHKVLGNTIIKATTWDMIPKGYQRGSEPPHEAISIAGSNYFEVAYNHVYNCYKEGIDVKETSKHGSVHHNYVHHVDRQGLYADAWFGMLEDVEFSDNVVHDCGSIGFALSVEDIKAVLNIRFHHNLLYNNKGSGIYFSRWGKDGPRTNIRIFNNTIHHNGYGIPSPGNDYYYVTGGLYLYSDNLQNIEIYNNIFSENNGFEFGYSDRYLKAGKDIRSVLTDKNISIRYNLVNDINTVQYPIHVGWPGYYADVFAYQGEYTINTKPKYIDAKDGNFSLDKSFPYQDIGAFPIGLESNLWWRKGFPPIYPPPTSMR